MDTYKITALNNYFSRKKLAYRLTTPNRVADLANYQLLFVNSLPIYVRVAQSYADLQRGLMHVAQLAPDEGCLLDFGTQQHVTLWMKNCKINLQAAMLDESGHILEIKNMSYREPSTLHHSSQMIRYALEMPEDFFTSHNIKIGDTIKL